MSIFDGFLPNRQALPQNSFQSEIRMPGIVGYNKSNLYVGKYIVKFNNAFYKKSKVF